jgi:hypothetical protein
MTAEGEIVDTLRLQRWAFPAVRRISFDGRQLTVPPPPSSAPLELALEDELYVVRRPVADDAARGEFTVTRTDTRGDTVFHRSFHYHPRPIDAAFVDSLILPQARAYARSAGIDADVVAASFRDAIELPGFLPPISSGRVMADSSLWLTREYDPVAGARWIVLDPDGAVRGALELPRTATVYWSRGDVLWTVVRDELDVPWLVKYRMRPGARD